MTARSTRLIGPQLVTTVDLNVDWTVPAGKRAIIKEVDLWNIGAATTMCALLIGTTGAYNTFVYAQNLTAGTIQRDKGLYIVLNPLDPICLFQDGTAVLFTVHGMLVDV